MEGLKPGDPEQIGRYRLLSRLGAGGMGNVYLGQSPSGRLVAVKIIRPELADDPAFRQRFAHEVTAARRVGGMFTAPVVDADPDAPQPWMVTAYVSGQSLAEAVASLGPLPARLVLLLAAGLAEGLGAVHAAGLVHRDLKPSNVVLASDGPRIIDFGISRAADSAVLTRAGGVVGSPAFMSPEHAKGREVGPASDVFSLGSLLTFAATGSPPFGHGEASVLLYRVVREPPVLDRVPAELRPLIEKCLAKDPAERPSTDDLLAELGYPGPSEDWLRWQGTAAAPDTGPPAREPSQSASAARPDAGAAEPADPAIGLPLAEADVAGLAALAETLGAANLGHPAGEPGGPRQPSGGGNPEGNAARGAGLHADAAGRQATAHGDAAGGWQSVLAVYERPSTVGPPARQRQLGQQLFAGGRGGAGGDGGASRPDTSPGRQPLPPWLGAVAILAVVAFLLVAIGLAPHQQQGGQPGGTGSSGHAPTPAGRHQSGQAGHAPGTLAVASNGASGPASGPTMTPSSPAPAPSSTEVGPAAVVIAYFTAINNREWNLAWALGGKNLYSSYLTMVADLTDISHDYVTIISTSGANVVASVRTVTIAGLTLIHLYSYLVQGGTIVSGILKSTL